MIFFLTSLSGVCEIKITIRQQNASPKPYNRVIINAICCQQIKTILVFYIPIYNLSIINWIISILFILYVINNNKRYIPIFFPNRSIYKKYWYACKKCFLHHIIYYYTLYNEKKKNHLLTSVYIHRAFSSLCPVEHVPCDTYKLLFLKWKPSLFHFKLFSE